VPKNRYPKKSFGHFSEKVVFAHFLAIFVIFFQNF